MHTHVYTVLMDLTAHTYVRFYQGITVYTHVCTVSTDLTAHTHVYTVLMDLTVHIHVYTGLMGSYCTYTHVHVFNGYY